MYYTFLKKAWIYSAFFLTLFLSCQKSDNSIPEKLNSFLPEHTLVIAILGSSTAEGTGATPRDSSWVNRLRIQLIAEGKKFNIINLAKAGFTTFNVLPSGYRGADTARNIDKALSYNPDLIIINLPTNDIANGYSEEVILNNYNIITRKIEAVHISFCLTSTQPRDFSNLEMRKKLVALNQKLVAVYPTQIVDLYSNLVGVDYFLNPEFAAGDGVHLNNKGHHVVFRTVLADSLCRSIIYK